LKTLILPSKLHIQHSLHLLYHLKKKLKFKQKQYKNYYSFTQILHDGQDAKKIIKKLKRDLHKVDKRAFIICFEVINRDIDLNHFSKCQHYGSLHLHCLIYTDNEINIDNIKNREVKQNFLKNKDKYRIQKSEKFLDYIFAKHQIFSIYDNNVKKRVKKLTKSYVFCTHSTNMCFNFIKLRYKGQAVCKYATY